ncbi:MAG: TauD/TfdA dioxygenase family protein [Lautropia sp.]
MAQAPIRHRRPNALEYRRIGVQPCTPAIGAEISKVDLSRPLDQETVGEIRRALLDHLVVFFRDQTMDREQHKAFGRRFGELHRHPGATLAGNDAEMTRIHADENTKIVAGEGWHSDLTCDPIPPMGSILHMHVLPESGGDTMFCSAYAAYDGLSDKMKAYLEGMTAHHDGLRVFGPAYAARGVTKQDYPHADHPIVCRHPETGRKLLFVNPEYTSHINGVSRDESTAILSYLYSQIGLPQYSMRFRWQKNSVAFWDNRSAQHIAVWDYYPAVRTGLRVQIQNTVPPQM